MVLGVPPSAMAVVPGFAGLIHGSRIYLLVSSLLGLAATAAALATIVNGTEETLVALVALTVILWAGATLRHSGMLTRAVCSRRTEHDPAGRSSNGPPGRTGLLSVPLAPAP